LAQFDNDGLQIFELFADSADSEERGFWVIARKPQSIR
jgi:hypothetical protein